METNAGKIGTRRWLRPCGSWRNHTPNKAPAYTRLTAAEALKQLRDQGFAEAVLPSPSTMADVLNRNGYRLRPVVKAKPQKNTRNRCHL